MTRPDPAPDFGPVITSLQNPWVKRARALQRRHARSKERAFLVEGVRAVADALAAGAIPTALFADIDAGNPAIDDLLGQAHERGARVMPTTATVIRAIADTQTPQGLIGIFPFPMLEPQVPAETALLALVADGIRDPGNLGTLIRSAVGAGCHAVFISPATTDPFAPKVVRAGMGAHFRLPILRLDWEQPHPLLSACPQRLAATAQATTAYDRVDWTKPSCLVIGSEAEGISAPGKAFVNGSVAIPLAGGLESLNAGVAGSVILFEAARQRRA